MSARRSWPLLALASLSLVLLAGVYVYALGSARGFAFDDDALVDFLFENDHVTAYWVTKAVFESLNIVSGAAGCAAIGALVLWRRGPAAALILLLSIAGAVLAAQVLKLGLGRVDLLGGEARRSLGAAFFPSGHATAVMALALAATSPCRQLCALRSPCSEDWGRQRTPRATRSPALAHADTVAETHPRGLETIAQVIGTLVIALALGFAVAVAVLAAWSVGYSAIPLYVSRYAGFVEAALVMLGLALALPLIVLAVLARGSPAG